MPAKVATAVQKQTPIVVDQWDIIELTENAKDLSIQIIWRRGLTQSDGSVKWLTPVQEKQLSAVPYLTLRPNGAKTFYQNLKEIGYKILQDIGEIPADASVS